MPTIRIGRRTIAALPAVEKPTVFYDIDLKGFGLAVRPSGSRSWILEYRPGSGGRGVAKRRIVLGSPEGLSPEDARRQARELLAKVRLGDDPGSKRAQERRAASIAALSDRYMTETGTKRKASTQELYRMYWRVHVLPALGAKRLLDVRRSNIVTLHQELGEEHPTTANRVVTLLRHFFTWAAKAGELPKHHDNPAEDVDRYRERSRQRFLSSDELARIGAVLREAETVGRPWEPDPAKKVKHAPAERNRRVRVAPEVATAIRLLLLTGCRLREVLHLRWEHVDLERGFLHLPDSKSGAKAVVLNAPAVALLAGLPRLGRYVIPGDNPEKPRGGPQAPMAAHLQGSRAAGRAPP